MLKVKQFYINDKVCKLFFPFSQKRYTFWSWLASDSKCYFLFRICLTPIRWRQRAGCVNCLCPLACSDSGCQNECCLSKAHISETFFTFWKLFSLLSLWQSKSVVLYEDGKTNWTKGQKDQQKGYDADHAAEGWKEHEAAQAEISVIMREEAIQFVSCYHYTQCSCHLTEGP